MKSQKEGILQQHKRMFELSAKQAEHDAKYDEQQAQQAEWEAKNNA
jgi:F0F1-type ATP synthase epsilon subunit